MYYLYNKYYFPIIRLYNNSNIQISYLKEHILVELIIIKNYIIYNY